MRLFLKILFILGVFGVLYLVAKTDTGPITDPDEDFRGHVDSRHTQGDPFRD